MSNPIQAVVEQIGRDVGQINRKIESLSTTAGGIEIIDNLTSDDTNKALSAKQGKELKKALDGKVNLRGQNDIHGSTAFFAQIFGMGGIRIAANARYNNQGHYAVMGANNNDAWWQYQGGGTVRIHKGDRLSFNNQTIYHEGNLPVASDDNAGVVTLGLIKRLVANSPSPSSPSPSGASPLTAINYSLDLPELLQGNAGVTVSATLAIDSQHQGKTGLLIHKKSDYNPTSTAIFATLPDTISLEIWPNDKITLLVLEPQTAHMTADLTGLIDDKLHSLEFEFEASKGLGVYNDELAGLDPRGNLSLGFDYDNMYSLTEKINYIKTKWPEKQRDLQDRLKKYQAIKDLVTIHYGGEDKASEINELGYGLGSFYWGQFGFSEPDSYHFYGNDQTTDLSEINNKIADRQAKLDNGNRIYEQVLDLERRYLHAKETTQGDSAILDKINQLKAMKGDQA